jgi:hypothetical protein
VHGVDRDDLSEQQAELVARATVVEAQEQHAQPEAERHQHSDDGVAFARPDPEYTDDRRCDE